MSIKYEPGKFLTYRATTPIHLGKFEKNILEDTYVDFDGQTVKYAGETFALPTLRSAIKMGWLVPEEDTLSQYIPQSAGVSVKSASGDRDTSYTISTVDDEERVVSSLDTANLGQRKGVTNYEEPTRNISPDRLNTAVSTEQAEPMRMEAQDPKSFRKTAVVNLEEQEGVPIGKVGVKAVQEKYVVGTSSDVDREVRKLEKSRKPAPAPIRQKQANRPLVIWDLKPHWKIRVKEAISKYGNHPDALRSIISQETSKGVIKALNEHLNS